MGRASMECSHPLHVGADGQPCEPSGLPGFAFEHVTSKTGLPQFLDKTFAPWLCPADPQRYRRAELPETVVQKVPGGAPFCPMSQVIEKYAGQFRRLGLLSTLTIGTENDRIILATRSLPIGTMIPSAFQCRMISRASRSPSGLAVSNQLIFPTAMETAIVVNTFEDLAPIVSFNSDHHQASYASHDLNSVGGSINHPGVKLLYFGEILPLRNGLSPVTCGGCLGSVE